MFEVETYDVEETEVTLSHLDVTVEVVGMGSYEAEAVTVRVTGPDAAEAARLLDAEED